MSNEPRPARTKFPSQRLANGDNVAVPELPSHTRLIQATHDTTISAEPATQTAQPSIVDEGNANDSDEWQPDSYSAPGSTNPRKRHASSSNSSSTPSDDNSDGTSDNLILSGTQPVVSQPSHSSKPKKKKKKTKRQTSDDLANNVDQNGMHTDVQVQEISDDSDTPSVLNKTKPTADIQYFFTLVPRSAAVPGDRKQRFTCNSCVAGIGGCPKKLTPLCGEVSTLRRHMASLHKNAYRKWAKDNNFESMLAEDSQSRRKALVEENLRQTNVDDHFPTAAPDDKPKPKPYTDALFREAAIQWLIETDQPIQALEHPSFKKMIEIAARATQGVSLPSRKQTRNEIMKMFKEQMKGLKERLHSKAVSGEVNLTCDAWQASNIDAYFAVTGHWIEEQKDGEWVEYEALLGFTQMNTAHNGVRLGQALYKICQRLDIVEKVGHITCDNASNNDTMLEEFARCYRLKTKKTFDVLKRHIRCLAHIINLATQALISTSSKAKFYSTESEDGHIPDTGGKERDVIGLVRAICVKARSSSQRKELFKNIQLRRNETPSQLLLDMKVRWGSTYVMLSRAEEKRNSVDEFVLELSHKESSSEKRRKLSALALDEEEWDRVRLFCNLLQHADKAQQAFSAGTRPSLHKALPALENLYAAWQTAASKPRYAPFVPGLEAAMAKLNEYYQRTAESDAHIIAMVLDPVKKFSHFKKNWSTETQKEVSDLVQKKFIERYKQLHSLGGQARRSSEGKQKHIPKGTRQNIDDTEEEDSDGDDDGSDPDKPWMVEWNLYVNTHEAVWKDMGAVRWWGLNAGRYPTWASLACDYLSIMASSVSSERAFSSAGITISKRRNRLKGDIAEALQVLKCIIHHNLIFRLESSSAELEKEMEGIDTDDSEPAKLTAEVVCDSEEFSWDTIMAEEEGE